MNLNVDRVKDLIDRGFVNRQKHPDFPLYILNYSKTVPYTFTSPSEWDDTLSMCRGLVVDEDWNIIARAFEKFWNYSQGEPGKTERVFEKLDGSLIITFVYENELIVASRGSFLSEQSFMARNIIHDQYPMVRYCHPHNVTLVHELIHPGNRIVVDYGDKRDLILLGAKENEKGVEYNHEDLKEFAPNPVVESYDPADVDLFEERPNHEGYVILDDRGIRWKIKHEEYVKVHRIVTNLSTKVVWERTMEGKGFEDIKDIVPEEYHSWADDLALSLKQQFEQQKQEIMDIYQKEVSFLPTRKDRALKIQEYPPGVRGALLSVMSDRPDKLHKGIWKSLKPKYERPLKDPDTT